MDVRVASYRPVAISANPAPRNASNVGFATALGQTGGNTASPAAAIQPLPDTQPNQRTANVAPMGPRGGLIDILV